MKIISTFSLKIPAFLPRFTHFWSKSPPSVISGENWSRVKMAQSSTVTVAQALSQISLSSGAASSSCSSKAVYPSFEGTFDFLIKDNLEDKGALGLELAETRQWLKRVMTYNVPQGKQLRGRLVETTYRGLVPNASEEMVHLSRVLGWCVEILQAALLVADDIMDDGALRRGQPCWYRVDNNGMSAVNDAFLLEHMAVQILRKYFKSLPCFSELLDEFLGVTFKTILGQSLDTRTSFDKDERTTSPRPREGGDPFESYNLHLYNSIVQYKTSYYTCYLPVALALSLSGISRISHAALWEHVEKVTLELGQLFQVQDDFIDCFGEEEQIGKVGMDIQDGKCTWLFVTAKNLLLHAPAPAGNGNVLQRQQQYALLRDNYGKLGADHVARVKQVYRELGIPKLFQDYQEGAHHSIAESLRNLNLPGLETVLLSFFDVLYKRKY